MTLHADVSKLRSIAWADFLHQQTGASSISGAEPFLFASSRFRLSDGGNVVRPSVLRRWMAGVTPNRSTLERMNCVVRGSLAFYEHALWDLLLCVGEPTMELITRLAPSVSTVMFSNHPTGPIQQLELAEVDACRIEHLAKTASIDSLAALLFCAKKWHYEGEIEKALLALKSFYHAALIIGIFRPMASIVAPLVAGVLQDFTLPSTDMRWASAREIERRTDMVRRFLASELIEEMALLPEGKRQITWPQICDLATTLLQPNESTPFREVYDLCLLLDFSSKIRTNQNVWGNLCGSLLAVDMMGGSDNWKFRRSSNRTPASTEFLGINFYKTMEVVTTTVKD